jgi:hypothetical protein
MLDVMVMVVGFSQESVQLIQIYSYPEVSIEEKNILLNIFIETKIVLVIYHALRQLEKQKTTI